MPIVPIPPKLITHEVKPRMIAVGNCIININHIIYAEIISLPVGVGTDTLVIHLLNGKDLEFDDAEVIQRFKEQTTYY